MQSLQTSIPYPPTSQIDEVRVGARVRVRVRVTRQRMAFVFHIFRPLGRNYTLSCHCLKPFGVLVFVVDFHFVLCHLFLVFGVSPRLQLWCQSFFLVFFGVCLSGLHRCLLS
jgi:hypothetical protein